MEFGPEKRNSREARLPLASIERRSVDAQQKQMLPKTVRLGATFGQPTAAVANREAGWSGRARVGIRPEPAPDSGKEFW